MDLIHFEKVLLNNSGQRGDFDIRQDRPRFWLPTAGCVDRTGDSAVSRQVRWESKLVPPSRSCRVFGN